MIYEVSEVVHFDFLEFTFLWFEKEVIFLYNFKDTQSSGDQFGDGCCTYQDIVHVNLAPSLVDFDPKDVVHHSLECSGGVAQSKEHDGRFV